MRLSIISGQTGFTPLRIDITAAVRSLLFIGKLKDSPTTRVLIHEKSSLAPPGQSLAFSLGDEKGFEWMFLLFRP